MKFKAIIPLVRLLVLSGLITAAAAQTVSIPDPGLNAAVRDSLHKPAGLLTEQDLLGLTFLSANSRNITNLEGLEAAHNLGILNLRSNRLSHLVFPSGLGKLTSLDISFNPLTNCSFPGGLGNLTGLTIENAQLTNLTLSSTMTNLGGLVLFGNRLSTLNLPAGWGNLSFVDLSDNQLVDLPFPAGLTGLTDLELYNNQLRRLTLPADMTNLVSLQAFSNQLTNLTISPTVRNLVALNLEGNQLSSFNVPASLSGLRQLNLGGNQLTNVTLPAGLTNLTFLFLHQNRLTNVALPSGLSNVTFVRLNENQLADLILPPDMTQLAAVFLDGNPFATLVVSERSAATNLAATVATLRSQGVAVLTYPLQVQLIPTREQPVGAFRFSLHGPPNAYTLLVSSNFADWSVLGVTRNPLGSVLITDTTAQFSQRKFYRSQQVTDPPAQMVFIPPNTFTMGSPTNEVGHRADESPQTSVTLTRGFWISKFLVTQGEYLAITGENPSGFPGNLQRPVESVSWFAASNYCVLLTALDLAAGRIASNSHYRLPTEAEWECAARAGSSTRFYYGEDPGLTSLTNHAWYGANSGFTPRPVGQKLPNAWGLFDMAGNVWEWCQDWYGPYAGGAVIDPQGPDTNAIGFKVMRGGAWEASEFDCRSARRSIQGASPFITDFIIGFRVVLVTDP